MNTTLVSVEMDDDTLRDLDELARRKGMTRTEALAASVASVKYLSDQEQAGSRIVVKRWQ